MMSIIMQGLDALTDLSLCHMKSLRKIEQYAFTPLKKLEKLVIAFNPLLGEFDDGAFESLVKQEDLENWPITEV